LLCLQRFFALLIALYPARSLFKEWLNRVNQWVCFNSVEDPEFQLLVSLMNDEFFYFGIHSGARVKARHPIGLEDDFLSVK
jgi:hypothetical protein